MRTVTSELLRIPGIGERKRRQLLEAFGSLEGVRAASLEAIAALPGFSLKSAAKIQRTLLGAEAVPASGDEAPASNDSMEHLTTISTNSKQDES